MPITVCDVRVSNLLNAVVDVRRPDKEVLARVRVRQTAAKEQGSGVNV